jgi:tRNA(Ile)-lysidine synthase
MMRTVAPGLQLRIHLAHVDHGISPDSADVAEQVMALAVRLKVPGHLVTLSLGSGASETLARRERYRALRNLQQKLGADYLVTAHHAGDQVETVLFRFLKGSGPAGLAGIAAAGKGGLVRPLLPYTRAELGAWLQSSRPPGTGVLAWGDPANEDVRHDRVWLRRELLPVLRQRFGEGILDRLLLVQSHAQADREAWSHVLTALPELEFERDHDAVQVAWPPLRGYYKTLSEALLRALAREAGCLLGPARAARLRRFLDHPRSGASFDLGEGYVAEVSFDKLRILPTRRADASPVAETWGPGERGTKAWDGWEFSWQAERARETTRGGFTTWVSQAPDEIRALRPGDRVEPLGGVGHRPVRRVLMEARVPRSDRARYPVLVRDGQVVWVPGVCRAAVDLPALGAAALRIDARVR